GGEWVGRKGRDGGRESKAVIDELRQRRGRMRPDVPHEVGLMKAVDRKQQNVPRRSFALLSRRGGRGGRERGCGNRDHAEHQNALPQDPLPYETVTLPAGTIPHGPSGVGLGGGAS